MDERLKFIARLLDSEKMAGLCREFGVHRDDPKRSAFAMTA